MFIKLLQLSILTFLLWGLALKTQAQQRFRTSVVLGLNASQILGDDVGGYNKPGLLAGLRSAAMLKDKLDLSVELLYSQRGSYNKDGSPFCFDGSLLIALQYVEVPVLLTYKEWYVDGYYKVQAGAGLSYGRLIKAKSEGSCYDDVVDLFNANDLSFTLGAEYFFNRNISFGVRWTRSINLLFNKNKHSGLQGRNSLRGYFPCGS